MHSKYKKMEKNSFLSQVVMTHSAHEISDRKLNRGNFSRHRLNQARKVLNNPCPEKTQSYLYLCLSPL